MPTLIGYLLLHHLLSNEAFDDDDTMNHTSRCSFITIVIMVCIFNAFVPWNATIAHLITSQKVSHSITLWIRQCGNLICCPMKCNRRVSKLFARAIKNMLLIVPRVTRQLCNAELQLYAVTTVCCGFKSGRLLSNFFQVILNVHLFESELLYCNDNIWVIINYSNIVNNLSMYINLFAVRQWKWHCTKDRLNMININVI